MPGTQEPFNKYWVYDEQWKQKHKNLKWGRKLRTNFLENVFKCKVEAHREQ